MVDSAEPAAAVRRTLRHSRYAQRLLAARPALEAEVGAAGESGWSVAAMRTFLAQRDTTDPTALAASLRELRARVFLRVASRDLAGLAALEEVVGTMSDLAEVALQASLGLHRARLESEHGAPGGAGAPELLVVGMGKLGGRELNVSSDIDLVFAYPEEGETARGLSNHEFFVRLGQRVIRTLADVTADGQVFRVDMRLRPWGESGPLAASLDALEQYFVAHGREWERYAWIKARVVAGGDPAARLELAKIVQPFVYRKYLDYATIDAVRKLHAQIRQEVARRDLADHIKLGPGGIREIEFIAQGFQLIRGGRDAGLRSRATLEVLAALAERRTLPNQAVAELSEAYVFLRRLEHRLQYLEDAQTHQLPASPADRALIAESMGAEGWDAFLAALERHRAIVTRHFESVFAASGVEANACAPLWLGTVGADDAERELARQGYAEPRETLSRIRALRSGSRYQQLPESSRERLDVLVPRLIEASARTQGALGPTQRATADVTLRRALDFVEAVSRRAAYLALLAEQPQALAKVAEILAASSWGAEYLTRHPILLDELLDARVLAQAPDWSEFATQLRREMAAHEGDVERQMDAMRELHHAYVFRLLTQDLAGLLTVERLADHLSLAADLVLAVTLEVCWTLVRGRHVAAPRFAVIGYGKLGGKELGYASDLDIVFVHDDPHESAPELYARFAQRISSWLGTRTSAGMLFETDLALRPSGGAGLLVSSMSAFRRYQLESAWAWEHQALTRARFVAGDAAIGAVFEAFRRDVLQAERDPAKLAAEVLGMRQRMLDAHPNRSGLFDLKHDRGGMVDIEFVVQYLVLAHARAHYELTGNLGNIALLHMAGALGLIPAGLASRVADAYREYRRLQHRLRLNGAEFARVGPESVAVHREATLALWQAVFPAA
jgi:glutamate-ammonia-ligase adenylyltransferase